MGNGASFHLTPEEKTEISREIASKYEESKGTADDKTLFQTLQGTYEQKHNEIIQKRKDQNGQSELINSSPKKAVRLNTQLNEITNDSYDAEDDQEFALVGSLKYQPTQRRLSVPVGEEPGRLIRAKTSSELLSFANDSAVSDEDKIANFIKVLKAGELQTNNTSTFRQRRLTFSQRTVDEVEENPKPKTPSAVAERPRRATLFSSSEIGVMQEKKPPFPDEVLGTYSCHGIEPSYDEEDGIHQKINQDRGCIVYPYRSKKDEALFIVLDGHGEQGEKVSEFVMRQIAISLEKEKVDDNPVEALKNCFVMTNTALLVTQIQYMTSGCTCVAVYVRGNKIYVANAGDSRAVMAKNLNGDGSFTAVDLSRDHKPDDPDEMKRILEWGGYVCPPVEVGLSARVYLDPEFTMIGLAMARSLGDHAVKNVGVIAEPEVKIYDTDEKDEFMIMASDGVWEFISSQEAVDIVQAELHHGMHKATQTLIETAASRWQDEEGDYRDDITAIVVKFPLPFLSTTGEEATVQNI